MAEPRTLTTTCCIAGGGPAGVMLGFLLARAGVEVVVLEKHADFLRDFRGDTVHPSTLEVMHELGLLERFLERPHQELSEIRGKIGGVESVVADFSHLPTHCKFVAMMPQWHFLDFLADEGRKYPTFRLIMEARARDLVFEGERVAGIVAETAEGPLTIHADLTVGADGRRSDVREAAGLKVIDLGAPIDVLWMRLGKRPSDPTASLGRFDPGKLLVMIDRGDYWQCAFVIAKGGIDKIKAEGLPALRRRIAAVAPELSDRVDQLATWDDIKLLTVTLDRLERWWRPGLVCIGDAAHAMSPVGGVGINLAIQDAVAAANILAAPLKKGRVADATLAAIQKRREWPTKVTQAAQRLIQERIIVPVLNEDEALPVPLPFRLLQRYSLLRRLPARAIGMGVRPEHVRTPKSH
ncbi:MAG TPA: FAD-dependent oxidoreductase [Caulobacteraceae bacterium]